MLIDGLKVWGILYGAVLAVIAVVAAVRLVRWWQVRRARRRYSAEALELALEQLGAEIRAALVPVGRALLPPIEEITRALNDIPPTVVRDMADQAGISDDMMLHGNAYVAVPPRRSWWRRLWWR